MEKFLQKPISRLSKNKHIAVTELNSIKSLLITDFYSKNNYFNNKDKDKNNKYRINYQYNMHVWLSPKIACIIAQSICNNLIKIYPEKKEKLRLNFYEFKKNIKQNDILVNNILNSSRKKKYFVFHDAYSYFEKYYKLSPLGCFTINPEIQPGIKKIYQIQNQFIINKVQCIFLEPQFNSAVINNIIKKTKINIGILDPLGIGLPIYRDSYMKFLIRLSKQYVNCLN
ncbi:metal ABC transporter solute-binding protein, Zn/Mn family [Candidatus Providencia siddallii]